MQYTIEIVKNISAIPQVYETSKPLDEIVKICNEMYKSNICIYLSDSQGYDIAHREFGKWVLAR